MANNNKKTSFGSILIVTVFLFILMPDCIETTEKSKEQAELTKINFETVPFIGEAPSYVAYHNGYFEEEGLNVTLKRNAAGKVSLKNLFEGEADIITVADTPIVYDSFKRDDFYIIGGIMHSYKVAGVVARKDKGINLPGDLKGKKVALFRGTASDFFMDSFFVANGLKPEDAEIVDMKPLEQVEAIVKGEIDAMFCWQPHILNAQNQLKENGIRLLSEGIKTVDWVIIVKKDYAKENPVVLEKFLRAILKAENFIKEHREESVSIHSEESGMDREIVDVLWNDCIYELYLDESLLMNLEDQARWVIKENKTDATEVPNYLDYIYFDALEKVKPEGITIIR